MILQDGIPRTYQTILLFWKKKTVWENTQVCQIKPFLQRICNEGHRLYYSGFPSAISNPPVDQLWKCSDFPMPMHIIITWQYLATYPQYKATRKWTGVLQTYPCLSISYTRVLSAHPRYEQYLAKCPQREASKNNRGFLGSVKPRPLNLSLHQLHKGAVWQVCIQSIVSVWHAYLSMCDPVTHII